jgi:SAM-dependent methyltransferase
MKLFQTCIATIRRLRYPGSQRYWERRYAQGGDSGAGSSGVLAEYKAGVLNAFVEKYGIQTVVELGCGDGQQLLLAKYPAYTGLDISPSAVARCRELFSGNAGKTFAVYAPERFEPVDFQADLAISLEVIFHLTEERVYQLYMQHLFALAQRWVVVFSSDEADRSGGICPHFRQRKFSDDVPEGWVLRERVGNPHRERSVSDFFVFERKRYR